MRSGAASSVRREAPGPVDDGDRCLSPLQAGYPSAIDELIRLAIMSTFSTRRTICARSQSDVRFVLVIGDDEFDWLAQNFSAKVLDCHPHGGDSPITRFMRELSGHVGSTRRFSPRCRICRQPARLPIRAHDYGQRDSPGAVRPTVIIAHLLGDPTGLD